VIPPPAAGQRPGEPAAVTPAPLMSTPLPVPAGVSRPAGYPPSPPPGWGAQHARPGMVPPPPREAWLTPQRVEAIPGTNFAVVHLGVPPMTSGLAVGSLVTGIASIVVSFVVGCFGLAGASSGWGAWVAGAFAMIAGLAGGAGIVLGALGMRQIRRAVSGIRITGRGMAIAGLVCGATGLGLTALGVGTSLLIQVSV
jgi:hypothetical protein